MGRISAYHARAGLSSRPTGSDASMSIDKEWSGRSE